MRNLLRTRKQLVREQSSHVLRVQKTLEDANIKVDSVLSDIMGKSGRAMIEAGPEISHNIIEKGLAFRYQLSVTVAATLRAVGLPRVLPRRLHRHCGASVVTARDAVANRTEDADETHRYPAGAAFRRRAAPGWRR
jgi:hypothetical protein